MANDPSNESSDYQAMKPYWRLVQAIMGGTQTMRDAGKLYLPKFEGESEADYERRRKNSRMTNIFADVVYNLSNRPFEQAVTLGEQTAEPIKEFSEDVTGSGDDLTLFAARAFQHALEDSITWLLIDHTPGVEGVISVAEEREIGARPYWTEYRAADVIAVYSDRVKGEERFVEVRLRESSIEREGFEEKLIERIRVFRHEGDSNPTWELWRKKYSATSGVKTSDWELEQPAKEMSISVIPLVPVLFGHRDGNGWQIDPPLRDAAFLQLELYQQENGLKNIRELTAFPMLVGKNIDPPIGDDGNAASIEVGPHSVLFGGTNESGGGDWAYAEPTGGSLQFLRDDVKDTIRDLRELGRQPLSLETGNITVIATAALTQKNNSAIQAWAGFLGKALERGLELTAEWLGLDDPEISVDVYADFDLGFGGDASFAHVLAMGTGPDPVISRDALLEEAKRRGILGSNYDPEEDLELIDTPDPNDDTFPREDEDDETIPPTGFPAGN